jgi:hypothetical protein
VNCDSSCYAHGDDLEEKENKKVPFILLQTQAEAQVIFWVKKLQC